MTSLPFSTAVSVSKAPLDVGLQAKKVKIRSNQNVMGLFGFGFVPIESMSIPKIKPDSDSAVLSPFETSDTLHSDVEKEMPDATGVPHQSQRSLCSLTEALDETIQI
jgi:hypothetical protein